MHVSRGISGVLNSETARHHVNRDLLAVVYGAEHGDSANDDGALVAAANETVACLSGHVDDAVVARCDMEEFDVRRRLPLKPGSPGDVGNVDRRGRHGRRRLVARRVNHIVPDQAPIHAGADILELRHPRKLRKTLRKSSEGSVKRSTGAEDCAKHVKVIRTDAARLRDERKRRDLQEKAQVLTHERHHGAGVPAAASAGLSLGRGCNSWRGPARRVPGR
mmetsp:Transcript_56051/g.121202  ORF Transcript_56051/g.121202 Transcript_56051/m.121202 type:complete len:220 (-) Transcript_56051:448-1107(-)